MPKVKKLGINRVKLRMLLVKFNSLKVVIRRKKNQAFIIIKLPHICRQLSYETLLILIIPHRFAWRSWDFLNSFEKNLFQSILNS